MTTFSADRAASTFPIAENHFAGVLHAAWGNYALTINPVDDDIYEMHFVPDNSTVVDGVLRADDMDSGSEALNMDLGHAANGSDVANPDALGDFGVWAAAAVSGIKPEASTMMRYNGVLKDGPLVFTKGAGKTMIQVEANVAAATFAAGDLTCTTYYLVP